MTIIQVLLGEHGAMYPLLRRIEETAPSTDLQGLKLQASLLESSLVSHADLEDELLRPLILRYLPQPTTAPDGSPAKTDHDIIRAGFASVLTACEEGEARRFLLDTIAKTRKHFLKEESVIFRIAVRELSSQHQTDLASQWAQRRGVLAS